LKDFLQNPWLWYDGTLNQCAPTKDELIEAIWPGRIVSEAALSCRISAARRALGNSGNDQTLIRTLHGRGFRFVGEVEEVVAAAALTVGVTAEQSSGCCPYTNRKSVGWTAAALLKVTVSLWPSRPEWSCH
jgi:hypothetical protein